MCDGFGEEDEDPRLCFEVLGETAMSLRVATEVNYRYSYNYNEGTYNGVIKH